jgi:hypothetical protein
MDGAVIPFWLGDSGTSAKATPTLASMPHNAPPAKRKTIRSIDPGTARSIKKEPAGCVWPL